MNQQVQQCPLPQSHDNGYASLDNDDGHVPHGHESSL